MFGELFAHALGLPLEGLAQVLVLLRAALPELVDGERRELLGPRLELGQELLDVAGRRGEEPPLDRFSGRAVVRVAERAFEEVERPRLRLPRVSREWRLALGRLSPARRQRYQLLVQPLRALTIERKPTQQDHARDRVGDLREAGTREIVVDEALRAEAGEQPLGNPLLEVQVDGVLGQHASVLEDDRPDRCLAAPVGDLLVLLAG